MNWYRLFFAINTPLEVLLCILTYTVSLWFSIFLMASVMAGIVVGVTGMQKDRKKIKWICIKGGRNMKDWKKAIVAGGVRKKVKELRVSVVICTKNRVQELVDCIKSVLVQSSSPYEVIIVDASDRDEAYLRIKEEFLKDLRLKYIHSTGSSGLSADRNKGVGNSSGDIVLFLDDDVVLEKNFIKEISEVFEKDSEEKVGGVMGNIVNACMNKTFRKKLHTNLHLLITRIFLLPTTGNGRFRSSGCPSFLSGVDKITNVEFLSGCCMAYRKEVFKDLKFDEDFPELYTDDEDFSRRVSLKYRNVYTPYAKLIHKLSPIGSASARRASQYIRSKKTVKSRHYLLKKNFPHTLKYTLAFSWSVVGLLVQAILTMNKESVKGIISGILEIVS